MESKRFQQRRRIFTDLGVRIIEQIQVIQITRTSKRPCLFNRGDKSFPRNHRLQRLVGISGLLFSGNQRFANGRIETDLFINRLTSLLKMGALLLLSLFKQIAQDTIMHFQCRVGKRCCQFYQ